MARPVRKHPSTAAMLIRYAPVQALILQVPERFDIALPGGKGSLKSSTMALLALQHLETYADNAKVLYIRKSHKSLEDFESICRTLFFRVYGKAASYNQQSNLWTFPHAGQFEIGQLETESDLEKFFGKSYTLLLIDEATTYANPNRIDRLRASLRGPDSVPCRCVIAGNPGLVGHTWFASRYVTDRQPGAPYFEEKSGSLFVTIPSSYRDNPFIDQAAYAKQLRAACNDDDELLKAWLDNDWSAIKGAFFAAVLDERRNMIERWPSLPKNRVPQNIQHLSPGKQAAFYDFENGWQFYLAMDYGSAAPCIVYLVAKSPGTDAFGTFFPRDSIILVDELAFSDVDDLSKGLGYTVPQLSEHIKAFCTRWNILPEGAADDACFSHHGHQSGSIANEFSANGVKLYPANKGGRVAGWSKMRSLLAGAGKPDVPGLYVSRSCKYWWATVPYLSRDKNNPDDIGGGGTDHGADGCRYGLTFTKPDARMTRLHGL